MKQEDIDTKPHRVATPRPASLEAHLPHSLPPNKEEGGCHPDLEEATEPVCLVEPPSATY